MKKDYLFGSIYNDYLDFEITNPNFIDKPITVEMLLNHTSSLSDLNKFNATTLSDLFKKNKSKKNFIKKIPRFFFFLCEYKFHNFRCNN